MVEQERDGENADRRAEPSPNGGGLVGGLRRCGLDSLEARHAQGHGPTLPTGQTPIRRQKTGIVGVGVLDEVAELLNRFERGVTVQAHAGA